MIFYLKNDICVNQDYIHKITVSVKERESELYYQNLLSKSSIVNGAPNSLLIETIISADGNISLLVASRKRSIQVNFIL